MTVGLQIFLKEKPEFCRNSTKVRFFSKKCQKITCSAICSNLEEYPNAVPWSVNEVSLLESTTSQPDVWNANAITGRKHQINDVFNSIYGGKYCAIGAIEDSMLRNKDDAVDIGGNDLSNKATQVSVDDGNGKLVKRTTPNHATDKAKEKRKEDSQEYNMNLIVESA